MRSLIFASNNPMISASYNSVGIATGLHTYIHIYIHIYIRNTGRDQMPGCLHMFSILCAYD